MFVCADEETFVRIVVPPIGQPITRLRRRHIDDNLLVILIGHNLLAMIENGFLLQILQQLQPQNQSTAKNNVHCDLSRETESFFSLDGVLFHVMNKLRIEELLWIITGIFVPFGHLAVG